MSSNESRSVTAFRRYWGLDPVIEAAKYFGILLGLLAFGYFGHRTHWNFGSAKHSTEERGKINLSEVDADDELTSSGWEIHFPSEKSLHRSGIKTSPIEQRPMHEFVKAVGVVTYDERMSAALSARVSGAVWSVVKQPGDRVRRGDVLVIIDAVEVGKAKANFFSELVDVESKTEIVSVLESVSGAVAGRQVREARVALREARIRLQNAEQTLVNLGFKVRKEAFENLSDSERNAMLQFLGLPENIVKDLDRSQTTSNLLALTAAFDGVLIRNDVAIGEMVEAGKPVVEIADLRRMWLKLDVPKEDASKLALGQRVRFTPDGLEREFDGAITWMSTEMNEQTRTLQVRAEVDNPVTSSDSSTGHEVRMLRANTFGTGTIALRETLSAFAVPVSAVLYADKQPMVFTKSGDRSFTRIDVKLGVREDQFIQIESPELNTGMQIVTQGCHVLKSEWILTHVASAGP
jgi:multidrug efflux pump subunit AcrA (membrane-fusion protein)